ncbi:MAG: ATP-binding protein [Cyanobacteria bacterium J06573_11]
MVKQRHLANRTKELDIFLKMAEGHHDCQIMFIEGKSGIGKTSLLTRFKQQCPVKYVPFDCKGVASVSAFLSQVVVDLGRGKFPTFMRKVKVFVKGGVEFSDNELDAEKMSIMINSDVDPATQAHRLEQLQQAFFDDLSKIEYRVVITLDTYQLANEDLEKWIESKWLRTVGQHLKNVVTVIAGQSVPDSTNNSVWGDECDHFKLQPIEEVTAWCKFCSDAQLNYPEEAIKLVTLGCKGNPKEIHQILSAAVERW